MPFAGCSKIKPKRGVEKNGSGGLALGDALEAKAGVCSRKRSRRGFREERARFLDGLLLLRGRAKSRECNNLEQQQSYIVALGCVNYTQYYYYYCYLARVSSCVLLKGGCSLSKERKKKESGSIIIKSSLCSSVHRRHLGKPDERTKMSTDAQKRLVPSSSLISSSSSVGDPLGARALRLFARPPRGSQ